MSADLAIRKGQIVSDAKSFFQWASGFDSSLKCFIVKQDDIWVSSRFQRELATVANTV